MNHPAPPDDSRRDRASTSEAFRTMSAIVQQAYGGPEVMQLGTRRRPTPGPGEVLIAVCAAAVDRGTWHLMTGRPYLVRLMGYGVRRPTHQVPGLDVSGVVVATGPGVARFAVGARVFGIAQGSLAEFAVAKEEKLALAPASIGLAEAAALGVSGLTALGALEDRARVAHGQRVLIVGASGGVGTYAVQLARAASAHVTAVCSQQKADLVAALGADVVLDYRTRDLGGEPARSYDVVLDIAGNTPLGVLRGLTRVDGVVVLIGGEHGGDWFGVVTRMVGALALGRLGGPRMLPFAAEEHHTGLDRLARAVDEGGLRPAIGLRTDLSGVADTMRAMESGALRGKALVEIGPQGMR